MSKPINPKPEEKKESLLKDVAQTNAKPKGSCTAIVCACSNGFPTPDCPFWQE